MKKIKRVNILTLVTIVCISLLYANTARNDESSRLHQQAKEEKIQSQNTGEADIAEDIEREHFPTNENGETYGTSIITEDGEYIDPDLIEAIGKDNVEGYVRYEDVFGHDNEYEHKKPKKISIPLYEVDGTTVIGEFIIENRNTMER